MATDLHILIDSGDLTDTLPLRGMARAATRTAGASSQLSP